MRRAMSNTDNQQTYCEKGFVRDQRPMNKRILENFTVQDMEVRPSLTIMRGVVFRVIVVCPVIDDRQSILAFGQGVFGHCVSLTYRRVLQSGPTHMITINFRITPNLRFGNLGVLCDKIISI